MSAESKSRSGCRLSNDMNETAFSGIEEKANDDEVLYGGIPNLSSSIYKEEKESDVPTHFDLEYFTRVHDVSTAVRKKSGNTGESSGVGWAASNSSALSASSDSMSPMSPMLSGKGREKGQIKRGVWTDPLSTMANGHSHSSDLTGSFHQKNKSAAVRFFSTS